jgi:hypothetical protein
MFVLKKHLLKTNHIFPKSNFASSRSTAQQRDKHPEFNKTLFHNLTLHDSFRFYTISDSYKTKNKYLLLAALTPIIASSGASLASDIINITFNPYTIKTNLNSLIIVSMFIKGLSYRFLLENSLDSKVPQLAFYAFNTLLFGFAVANIPMNYIVCSFTYGMFAYSIMAPFKPHDLRLEVIAIYLAIVLIGLSIFRNFEKWNETLSNEGKLDEAIQFHRLSNDTEFGKHMDDYVKYLQQWDVNLFAKKH